MAKSVTVTIAGRSYRMACGEGEERRLLALGRHVDQTLTKLRTDFGEIGDQRLVIMTAITLADDLFEAKRRIGELEGQIAGQVTSQHKADELHGSLTEEIATSLDVAAERVERIVRGLRQPGDARRRVEV